jgi:hypothetical protein
MELPKIKDRIDMKHQYIDGTPDGQFALRILKFFRARCNEKWIVEDVDEKARAIYDAMNEHQDLRAKELNKAISILSKEQGGL